MVAGTTHVHHGTTGIQLVVVGLQCTARAPSTMYNVVTSRCRTVRVDDHDYVRDTQVPHNYTYNPRRMYPRVGAVYKCMEEGHTCDACMKIE